MVTPATSASSTSSPARDAEEGLLHRGARAAVLVLVAVGGGDDHGPRRGADGRPLPEARAPRPPPPRTPSPPARNGAGSRAVPWAGVYPLKRRGRARKGAPPPAAARPPSATRGSSRTRAQSNRVSRGPAGREAGEERGHLAGPGRVQLGKARGEERRLLADDGGVEDGEVDEDRGQHGEARRGARDAEGQERAAQVERVAGVRVGAAGGQAPRLLDVARGPDPERLAGQREGQAARRSTTASGGRGGRPARRPRSRGGPGAATASCRRGVRSAAALASRRSAQASTCDAGTAAITPSWIQQRRRWQGAHSGARRTVTSSAPNGPLRAGSVGPKTPTTGAPTAQARCSGPVSAATTSRARRASSAYSSSVVGKQRSAVPADAATTRRPAAPRPGPR